MSDEKTLFDLLAEAQSEIESPKKDKRAQLGKREYKYADLGSVLSCIKPHLNSRGIFLSQKSVKSEQDNIYLIETSVSKGNERIVLDTEPYQYDADPREYGKRETYAKRYSLCKAFAIEGDQDTDGDVNVGHPQNNHVPENVNHAKSNYIAERVKKLKKEAIDSGVSEHGINDWYKSNFGEIPVNRLDESQVDNLITYLVTIKEDAESL